MVDKQEKNKYERDFDFHDFFFKSISNNGQEINEFDLEKAIKNLGIDAEYARQSEKIILRTEDNDAAESISFQMLEEKLNSLLGQ